MMNKSLSRKLIIVFSAILVTIVSLTMALNALLLPKVYRQQKINSMEELYCSLFDEYNNEADNSTVISIVKNTLSSENLRVFIWDENNRLIIDSLPLSYEDNAENAYRENPYPEPQAPHDDKFFNNKHKYFRMGRMEQFLFYQDIKSEDLVLQSDTYTIFSFSSFDTYDEETLCLRSHLPGNYKLLIQTPCTPIDSAVSIANILLLLVGTIMLIIGIIVVAVTSRTIAKPVKELSQIAKSMENLDFSEKYTGKGRDEIASLGESINSLSSKLEATISKLKESNKKLLYDIELKSKIDTLRKDFIANASHELKTPLALISGYAEGLRDNIADNIESREFYTSVIIEETEKMDKIIRQMLDLMELDGEDTPLEEKIVSLSKAASDVVSTFELIFKQNNINISSAYEEDCLILADCVRIKQVISNFLSNAVNHIDENKILEIKVVKQDNNVFLSVFNSGANIPESESENIWERFYKIDKAHSREYGGSGLGLSIVRSVIELHKGKYGFKNHPNGVEFYFSLPHYKENYNED